MSCKKGSSNRSARELIWVDLFELAGIDYNPAFYINLIVLPFLLNKYNALVVTIVYPYQGDEFPAVYSKSIF
jgi:hypothetical protein